MKMSEFVLTHTIGSGWDKQFYADVSVTTGVLWWKRVERRKIVRPNPGFWYFLDTGEFVPGFQAENLERSYRAKENLSRAGHI